MEKWRIDLAYDGTGFHGWARQPGLRTVQEHLEAALATALRRPAPLTVAGRTDAGVHALEQVASFEATREEVEAVGGPEPLKASLNALTEVDLAVWRVCRAPGFDARRRAISRRYLYRVDLGRPPSPFERNRALWWPRRIDRRVLDQCGQAIVGQHDFTAFTPTKTEHVHFERKVFAASWSEEAFASTPNVILVFRIEADAFMRNMVRILVGTMLETASGSRSLTEFTSLLAGAPRSAAGSTAPAHGLFLAGVRYENPGT